jgi:peptide/nickel transport system permease protein
LGPWKTVTPSALFGRWANHITAGDSEGNGSYIDRIAMACQRTGVVSPRHRQSCGFMGATPAWKLPVFWRTGWEPMSVWTRLNGNAVSHEPGVRGTPKSRNGSDSGLPLGLPGDRPQQLNETFWLGVGTPAQSAALGTARRIPGWRKKWSVLDVKQANRSWTIGFSKDGEGYRLRTDGRTTRIEPRPSRALHQLRPGRRDDRDQWKIGIQTDVREVERSLFFTKIANNEHHIALWVSDGSEQIYLFPRYALPVDPAQSLLGQPIARWYASNGAQGKAPKDPQLLKVLEMFRSAPGKKAPERRKLAQEIWKILVDEQWSIGTVGQSPAPGGPSSTSGWEHPGAPGERPAPGPGAASAVLLQGINTRGDARRLSRGSYVIPEEGCSMVAYLVCRLMLAVLTMWAVSVLSFVVIQLPPGDYITSYIAQMSSSGSFVSEQEANALRAQYGLDQPQYIQYIRWMKMVLQGNFGMALEYGRPVAEVIGDRIYLTMVVSVAAIIFTWCAALPIGVYSAVRQYSFGDYVATFIGFIGLAIPSFMLALILMYFGFTLFNANIGGLFSDEFAEASWSLAKLWDLTKHLPLPAVILGLAGTAQLIRIMRANLLDELGKPYVVTARARGLSESRLIIKYPVRVALNPFASTIGYLLPYVVSGSIIVSLVLSPAHGEAAPAQSLVAQDMFLAGTIVLLLVSPAVIGTFISDLLLMD